MTTPFAVAEVGAATYRDLGRQVGEATRAQIGSAVAFLAEHHAAMTGMTFAEAERRATGLLAHAGRCVPACVEELEGMAEGATVPLIKLVVLNCTGEFARFAEVEAATSGAESGASANRRERGGECTSLAICSGGRAVVGHNEDWYAVDAEHLALIRATCPDGTRLLSIVAAGRLPFTGINSYGIATGHDAVPSLDLRVGVPDRLVRRRVVEARSLEEARERALTSDRARGSNHLLADAGGRIWSLETSATAAALLTGNTWLAHTNHYVSPELADLQAGHSEDSVRRLQRAQTMIAEGLARGDEPRRIAAAVLRDHGDDQHPLCTHADPALPLGAREMTVASMIWDLEEMTMEVCAGPPCANEYSRFALD